MAIIFPIIYLLLSGGEISNYFSLCLLKRRKNAETVDKSSVLLITRRTASFFLLAGKYTDFFAKREILLGSLAED